MATMRPLLSEDQLNALPSRAEARFYRACRDQLPNDVLVVHSTTWAYRDKLHQLREGEADFSKPSINRALFIDADEVQGLVYEAGSAMFQGSSAS
ncbi:MAG: hypothetical protein JSS56_23050 [Proteobacteria bacterium]|nr:hypothetical protein [Pseudomonadota bacterium]